MNEEEDQPVFRKTGARFDEDEVEGDRDSKADDTVEESEDIVLLAVPTRKPLTALDGFWTLIGGEVGLKPTKCRKCAKPVDQLVELLTVCAPCQDLSERFISIYTCKSCGEFQCTRRQSKSAPKVEQALEPKTQTSKAPLFGADAFSSEAPTDEQLEELFAASAKVSEKSKNPTKSQSKPTSAATTTKKKPTPKKGLIFEFVDEPEIDEEALAHERALLEKYNKEAQELGEETFRAVSGNSRAELANGECDTDDFVERLQLDQTQRVRYDYGGKPLIPSRDIATKVKQVARCESCSCPRRFEFQVTPQAINDIRKTTGLEVEFSTILVYCCEESCEEGSNEELFVCPAF